MIVSYNSFNRHKYKKILFLFFVFLITSIRLVYAQINSKVILYNSAYDYFNGDSQEYVSYMQFMEELNHYPPYYVVVGFGAASQNNNMEAEHFSAVLLDGLTSAPFFKQITAASPRRIKPIRPKSFSWLQAAICNPKNKLERSMKNVNSVHQFTANQLERITDIKMAAMIIEGDFTKVTYSPEIPVKGRKITTYYTDTPHKWRMFGLYFKDYELQLAGAASGAPVILFGLNEKLSTGGYIYDAFAKNAKVTIYPLAEYSIIQSDLELIAAKIDGFSQKLMIRIKNNGGMGVRGAKLRMQIPMVNIVEEKTISLGSNDEMTVLFDRPLGLIKANILFQIDYLQTIRELREDNNTLNFSY